MYNIDNKWKFMNYCLDLFIFIHCLCSQFCSGVIDQEVNRNSSTTIGNSNNSNPFTILWISIGFAIAAVLLIVILCCLIVLIYILKSNPPPKCESNSNFESEKIRTFSGDHVLATSAQRYHFAHQKQQMLTDSRFKNSFDSTTYPNDLVYECPALGSTTKMEIDNPGFITSPGADRKRENEVFE